MAKALIISDDDGTRYLYEVAITYQKIEVETADSMVEGIKKISEDKPDIVILDVRTKDIDEVNIVKEVKCGNGSLPVIIMTDMKNQSGAKSASVIGACQFMVRGESSLHDLIKTVREAVRA